MTGTVVNAVVFDIDGTLLTTGGAGAKAWQAAFADAYQVTADISDFTEDGMPDHEVCRATFEGAMGRSPDEAEIADLLSRYLGHLEGAVAASTGYRIMPAVTETLRSLTDDRMLLGITSGNLQAAAHIKLGRGQLNRWFAFGGYGSDSPDRGELTQIALERGGTLRGKPLDPASVLVVGDTPRDVAAAHAVGAFAVAVATGHFTYDQLAESGADLVLSTLEQPLPRALHS
jgi:phosphoglycolate phosphatase